jgi:hypothetical protein
MIAFSSQAPDKGLARAIQQTYIHMIDPSKRIALNLSLTALYLWS